MRSTSTKSSLMALSHEFVKNVPEKLEIGVIYVSMEYATAIHLCCCGCGHEVVTPFSTTDWQLMFDGQTISLNPSIGNWNFKCQSHYWIRNNKVEWLPKWSKGQIERGRRQEEAQKSQYFKKKGRRPWFNSFFGRDE